MITISPNETIFNNGPLAIIRAKLKTSKILAIFEPIILPKAISGALLITAFDATNISGTDVPKPIITIPIIIGDIFSFIAKLLEPFTK